MAFKPYKRRRLTPPPSDDDAGGRLRTAFLRNAASWHLEQEYENRPQKGRQKDKENTRLPMKTSDGQVKAFHDTRDEPASDSGDADWLSGSDGENNDQSDEGPAFPSKPEVPEREQILQAQEELAKIALSLQETPEENAGAFKALGFMAQSRIVAIRKLCLLTQLAVYKDVIPGYRIRPLSEDRAGEQLSKEVRRVQSYEQSLVAGYQAYIKDLATVAKGTARNGIKSEGDDSLAALAIACACALLTAVPHFNFRSELIKILVRKLSTRSIDASFDQCIGAFETLFEEDNSGAPSRDGVSLLTKMMKVRNWQVDERVLNLFLYLRLLSDFTGRASRDTVEAVADSQRSKQKQEFRTKRERKALKEQKSLARAMAEADALVGHEERERMQSDTLKMVFATYFRILKDRVPHLMGAVQEGLVKYAHRINQDFFGDLLEALKDLMRTRDGSADDQAEEHSEEVDAGKDAGENTVPPERNMTREALLSTVTAFALLAGQDAHNARADLHLDLSYFVTQLFSSLLDLSVSPGLEYRGSTSRSHGPTKATRQPASSTKVNYHTLTVLLVRCLTFVLLPPWNIRSVPPSRLAAFTKQLMTASMHMPEKSCQALLALVNDVLHTHGAKIVGLWNTEDRKGDGTFNPLSTSAEGSNPFAATIWEGEMLRKHYCPHVRDGVKLLEKQVSSM
jgi:nucleolar complex protein 3